MDPSTDRIEREVVLKTPRARVWRLLCNASKFGEWFGVALKGKSFVPGKRIKGNLTRRGYERIVWDAVIQLMVPERLLSLRWHPYAVRFAYNYSNEPTTLVEFKLTDADDATLLTIVESGFNALPESRREEAYQMNSAGWDEQIKNIEKHVVTPRRRWEAISRPVPHAPMGIESRNPHQGARF
jgi:uncharacterized protein YndB with AHSA1/START domain